MQIKTNMSINSGVTLILPYVYNENTETNTINTSNGGVTAVYRNSDSSGTPAVERNPLKKNVYAKADSTDANGNLLCTTKVVVCSNVNIYVYSGGRLIISGQLDGGGGGSDYAGQTSGYHARLVLREGSKINVNGTIYALGFIDDESSSANPAIVTIASGGFIYQPFVIRDFKGGSRTGAIYLGMSDYGYTPFRQFTFMNVNTKLKIDYGAYLYGIANIYADGAHNMDVATFVSTVSDSGNSFIQLKSGAYLVSKYDESTQITTLDIFGGAKVNEFSVTVEKIDKTASSKEFIFPISWMYHVTLNSGEYEMCEGNRFKLLPGAEFTVEQGATLYVTYLSIYDSFIDTTDTRPYPSKYPTSSSLSGTNLPAAKLIVRGTLYATALGGRVYTDVDGAVVKVYDFDTSDRISAAVKVSNNEPASYGLGNLYVSTRHTFNTTLKLYYLEYYTENGVVKERIVGSTGYTVANTEFTSYTSGATRNWRADPEITSYPTIVEITFTGKDSAGNPYYVRTDEAIRYDANGKPEFYTFEYDHEAGGNQTIQVFVDAEIIFTLTKNQLLSANGSVTELTVEPAERSEDTYLQIMTASKTVTPMVYDVPALSIVGYTNVSTCKVTYKGLTTSNPYIEIVLTKEVSATATGLFPTAKATSTITLGDFVQSSTVVTVSNGTTKSGNKYTATKSQGGLGIAVATATAQITITVNAMNDVCEIISIS